MTAQRDEEQPPQPRHSPATNKQDVCVSSTNTDLFSLSAVRLRGRAEDTRAPVGVDVLSHAQSLLPALGTDSIHVSHLHSALLA